MNLVLQVHSLQRASTQSVPLSAYGCPLVDSCSPGRPFSGARIPFFASVLLDGLILVSDEYAAVNSVCYDNLFDDCQPGGSTSHKF